jgi:Glycosyl transferases group 1
VLVSHFVPVPPRAGNEQRLLHLLRWLRGRGYDVVFVLNALHRPRTPEADAQLELLRREVRALEVVRGRSFAAVALLPWRLRRAFWRAHGAMAALQELRRQLQPCLQQHEDAFCPPPMLRAIDRVVRRWQPSVMLAEYVFMTRCFAAATPGMLKVVDTHDLFSARQQQVVAHGIDDAHALTAADEARLLRRADLVVVIQDHERRAVERLAPGLAVVTAGFDAVVAPPAVDATGAPRPVDNSPRVAGRVLLVGSDNAVNVRALRDFLALAWPAVRAARPDATLRVVGALVRHRVDADGVEWRGFVDELAPEYAACAVVINPALAGSGLKIKSAEALAQRRPLVAWPQGVAGLESAAPPYVVAADWPDFAAQVVALLDGSPLRATLEARFDAYLPRFAAAHVYAELGRALDRHCGVGDGDADGDGDAA